MANTELVFAGFARWWTDECSAVLVNGEYVWRDDRKGKWIEFRYGENHTETSESYQLLGER